MKVLLFTHKVDIDGMGSAVFAKLAFNNPTIVFCDTFEIDQKIEEKFDDNSIYDYDRIFVTDLCPSESMLERLSSDKNLTDKFLVLDHHISILEKMSKPHKNTFVIVENEFGKCSGTSLFYDYMLSEGLIFETASTKEFAELTRQYDTWEWKNIYHNETANDLNIMFSLLKIDGYVEYFYNILHNNFELFDAISLSQIQNYKNQQKIACEESLKQIHVEKVNGYTVAVIDAMTDENKNDVAEMLKSNNPQNVDYIAMVITSRNTLSLRAIKSEINIGNIAEAFGGKGHKSTGSCVINNHVKNIFNINETSEPEKNHQ